jgi:hypothetical protein
MERQTTPTPTGEREIRDRGMGLDSLWRPLAHLFLGLCVLVPVALFLLFLPMLAQMLSAQQMTARIPAGVVSVDTRGTAPALP